MANNNTYLPEEIYLKYLNNIKGFKFSRREIDVISCLIKGRSTKKISSILSISPKTVATHIRNIMLKMDLNSREGILDFIERSGRNSLFNNYYQSLLIEADFIKKLRDISKMARPNLPTCRIFFRFDQKGYENIVHEIEKHLSMVGIKAIFEQNIQQLTSSLIQASPKEHFIYIIPKIPSEHSHSIINEANFENLQFVEEALKKSTFFTVFSLSHNNEDLPQALQKIGCLRWEEKESYYLFFFKILKKILFDLDFDKIISDFEKNHDFSKNEVFVTESKLNSTKKNNFNSFINDNFIKNKKVWIIFLSIVSGMAVYEGFPAFKNWLIQKTNQHNTLETSLIIRSDLTIPSEKTLLKRPLLLNEIEGSFKKNTDIQAIALVGMGGTGKTIIARRYAHYQKSSIIWEINAETLESLIESFEDLAQALSQSEEEKSNFKRLQEARNPKERIENITSFVKKKLKIYKDWFLIFDNVENFSDIQRYFPVDPEIWGTGQVIVTTRDANIQNNDHIDTIIQVGELDKEEKLSLFLNILVNNNADMQARLSDQKNEISEFLSHLPPFPLDISIAAYYLKSTNISFEKYLDYLKQYREDFVLAQADVLKYVSEYTKTRYSIISIFLQKIRGLHKDFDDLLLFVSLIDNQNIPRHLLGSFKSDLIVDSFIYNLKKYSLITREARKLPLSKSSSFSIHQNIQNDMFIYFLKLLNINKNDFRVKSIASFFSKYMADLAKQDDIVSIRHLISHVESFLRHREVLGDPIIGDLTNSLALFHVYLGDYKKAEALYKESLSICKKCYGEDHVKTASVKRGLGSVFRSLGEYEHSKDLLQQALEVFKTHYGCDNQETIETVLHLGNTCRSNRDYKKAKEFLEKGLKFYEKNNGKTHINVAWTLVHLGVTYRRLGDYERSIESLQRGFNIYKKLYGIDNIYTAWALIHLSSVDGKLGQYDKALKNLYQGLNVVRKHFGDHHIETAIALINLGNVHQRLGNYTEALKYFKEGYDLYSGQYGKNHIETCWSAIHLGAIYRHLGDVNQAKTIIELNANIYIEKYGPDHPSTGWAILNLADVYKTLGIYEKANQLYRDGLRIYTQYFGQNHPNTAQILRSMGEIQLLQENLDSALALLNKALIINQDTQSIETCFTLEILADLYVEQFLKSTSEQKNTDSERFNRMALNFAEQAHQLVESNFPKNSFHCQRIRDKLNKIKKMAV